jgi:hypothetical protein
MTYKEIENQVLKLLNQYTMAGSPVADLYNNQKDYLERIPTLANDAIMEIATTARKIPATMNLSMLPSEDLGQEIRYWLPFDFYQFKSGDTVVTTDGKFLHTNQYSLHGRRVLIVPKDEAGDYFITYYRYPMLLEEKPAPEDELDNAPETHFAIPFYVASFLVAHDEPFLCSLFMNKYNDKLRLMQPNITAEVHATADAYSFF